jgi:hypothetical protein
MVTAPCVRRYFDGIVGGRNCPADQRRDAEYVEVVPDTNCPSHGIVVPVDLSLTQTPGGEAFEGMIVVTPQSVERIAWLELDLPVSSARLTAHNARAVAPAAFSRQGRAAEYRGVCADAERQREHRHRRKA